MGHPIEDQAGYDKKDLVRAQRFLERDRPHDPLLEPVKGLIRFDSGELPGSIAEGLQELENAAIPRDSELEKFERRKMRVKNVLLFLLTLLSLVIVGALLIYFCMDQAALYAAGVPHDNFDQLPISPN